MDTKVSRFTLTSKRYTYESDIEYELYTDGNIVANDTRYKTKLMLRVWRKSNEGSQSVIVTIPFDILEELVDVGQEIQYHEK